VLQRQKHGSWRDQPVTGSRLTEPVKLFKPSYFFKIYPLLFFLFLDEKWTVQSIWVSSL